MVGVDLVSTAAREDHFAAAGGHLLSYDVECLLVEGAGRIVWHPALPDSAGHERRVLHGRHGGVPQAQVTYQCVASRLLESADPPFHEQPEGVDGAEADCGSGERHVARVRATGHFDPDTARRRAPLGHDLGQQRIEGAHGVDSGAQGPGFQYVLGGLGVEDREAGGREGGRRPLRKPVHPFEESVGAVAVLSAQGACHGPWSEPVRPQMGPEVGQVPGTVEVFSHRYEIQRRGPEHAGRDLYLSRAYEQ